MRCWGTWIRRRCRRRALRHLSNALARRNKGLLEGAAAPVQALYESISPPPCGHDPLDVRQDLQTFAKGADRHKAALRLGCIAPDVLQGGDGRPLWETRAPSPDGFGAANPRCSPGGECKGELPKAFS